MYIVRSEYIISESGEEEYTLHGPFQTIEDAKRWIKDQPSGPDTLIESAVLFVNAVK